VRKLNNHRILWGVTCFVTAVFSNEVLAAGQSLGDMASLITGSFTNISKLVTAGSYVAGLGFAISAIMKFKQHKDNPQQVPIGTPIGLTFIAASLLFLPSILGITGTTMFSGGGTVAGPTGTVFTGQ
jgi:intracellular multiplication protein IcmD